MKCKCEVMSSMKSLSIKCEGKKWGVIIRRVDDKEDDQFLEFHGSEMSIEGLRRFIPNYQSIRFKKRKIGSEPLPIFEYSGEDKTYKILITREDEVSEDQMLKDLHHYLE